MWLILHKHLVAHTCHFPQLHDLLVGLREPKSHQGPTQSRVDKFTLGFYATLFRRDHQLHAFIANLLTCWPFRGSVTFALACWLSDLECPVVCKWLLRYCSFMFTEKYLIIAQGPEQEFRYWHSCIAKNTAARALIEQCSKGRLFTGLEH